ncbi:hypothetical protein [Spirosoma sp. KNUC1025]|uniref:hypothetical protein n=1 Tax=Spirosoma sp. KNUC1025 TaxID=2894082 RepID=UPI00387057A6|nr:hypothetical protein LN737_27115 [Spirosoma sp. KNUC1025]
MKLILSIFTLIVLSSGCGGSHCELDAENYRPRECAIKVASNDGFGPWFSIEGTNANNGNRNRYSDLGRWYTSFTNHVAKGDTVIKRRNELVFYIHKKDTVLAFPYECEGKIIK